MNATGNSTTLPSSKNPSLVGDSVTFTATVTAAPPASGTPTGTVTFKDGSTTVGTGTLAAGVATLTTSALALGDHNMTAVYGGDAVFSTTTSATLVQRVTNNAGCTAAGNNLCVQNGRFTIGVAWQNQYAGTTGVGSPIAITADSGYFTFFSPNNIELLVKVLDGRSVNGNFWVLYGALSDVAYTITVTDTTTSTVKTYKNPAGTLASFSDTTAFPSARAAGAMTVTGEEYGQLAAIQWAETLAQGFEPKTSGRQALAGACTTSGGTLCIQGGRFSVSVAWKNYNNGTTGTGTAVSLASDSGSFWFFNSSNIELLVKVLDGRSVNGKFWFGYGALSDVEYTITVTDTNTGAVKTYNNPAHNLGSKLDLNAF